MSEQDDYPDPEPVELVTEPCPGCGAEYTHPADECDPCCSAACASKFYAVKQAEVNAALAAWWARERETMQTFRCVECGIEYTDYPTTDGCCSTTCSWEQVAKMYADNP